MQLHLDFQRVVHHVVIGEDKSVLREDHAGPGAELFRQQAGRIGAFAIFGRRIAGRKNLHNGGTHALGEGFKRSAQFAERNRGFGLRKNREGGAAKSGAQNEARQIRPQLRTVVEEFGKNIVPLAGLAATHPRKLQRLPELGTDLSVPGLRNPSADRLRPPPVDTAVRPHFSPLSTSVEFSFGFPTPAGKFWWAAKSRAHTTAAELDSLQFDLGGRPPWVRRLESRCSAVRPRIDRETIRPSRFSKWGPSPFPQVNAGRPSSGMLGMIEYCC